MQADVVVLGAGMVGVSVAIHLQMRGRTTVLLDRLAEGAETSYGNTGLIERAGVLPQPFPQDPLTILRYGTNTRTDMHYHPSALPTLAPFLFRYWRSSHKASYDRLVKGRLPLIEASISEHQPLIERSGAADLIIKDGCYLLYRDEAARDAAFRLTERMDRDYGLSHVQLDEAAMRAREPGLGARFAGAVHRQDSWSITDPGALLERYRALFRSLGGTTLVGDALGLAPGASGRGWRLATAAGPLEAAEAVVALGPWAGDLTQRLGYRLPLGVKRGYHMHYANPEAQPLRNWVLDASYGYFLAPMAKGIRLTTGAEFAHRDAPSTPVQLRQVEPHARELFPGMGARLDAQPWRGARPVTADMLPVIGRAPRHDGLWFAFGHAHHGITLGPPTGRLLAEMMTGDAPFIDPRPFSAERFL